MRTALASGLILLALATAAAAVPADDPGDDPALADALRAAAAPLPAGDPAAWTDADLAWLDRYATAPVLAFGEAAHGTATFTAVRLRLLRYLVERHGYRVLALEAHATECLFLERCLAAPDCDLAAAMDRRMLIWTSRTRGMEAALAWLRDHNAAVAPDARVVLAGIDSQVRDQAAELLHLLAGPADAGLGGAIDSVFAALDTLARDDYAAMDAAALGPFRAALDGLQSRFAAAAAAGRLDAADASRAAVALRAADRSLVFLQAWFHDGRNLRERQLRDTLVELRAAAGPGARIVLWAHNAHVAVDPGYSADTGGSLGCQARALWGDDYRAVALTFVRGEFRAKVLTDEGVSAEPRHVVLAVEPPAGSLNRLLDAALPGPAAVLLDTVAPGTDLGRWLDRPRAVLGVGDLFLGWDRLGEYHYGGDRVLTPLAAFDAVVHLPAVAPSRPLADRSP